MIRINLLGVPKPKKGKQAAAAMGMAGEGPNAIIVGIVVLVVAATLNGYLYLHLNNQAADLQQKVQAEQKRGADLASIKQDADRLTKQVAMVQNRVHVIDQLRSAQSGPVDLLNMIGNTINNTDAVWLITMQDHGNAIALTGAALNADAVAALVSNLKKTGYFKSVEFQDTFQDDSIKDVNAYAFSLLCEKSKS